MEKRYWFRAKKYGYGWTPTTWEGWFILLFYVAFVFHQANKIGMGNYNLLYKSISVFVFATLLLFFICILTGDHPRIRIGNRRHHEDHIH